MKAERSSSLRSSSSDSACRQSMEGAHVALAEAASVLGVVPAVIEHPVARHGAFDPLEPAVIPIPPHESFWFEAPRYESPLPASEAAWRMRAQEKSHFMQSMFLHADTPIKAPLPKPVAFASTTAKM